MVYGVRRTLITLGVCNMFMVSKESQYLCAMVHKETSGGGNQYDKPQELGPSYYCKASDKVARGDRLTGV